MVLFLTQLLPLIVFIVVDSFVTDVRISIVAAILFAVGQMVFVYVRTRRFEWLILIDVGLIVALGGVSIAFDNELFFKVKPAIIEGLTIVFIAVLILAPGRFLLRYFGRMMPGMVFRPEALRMMKLMLGLICAGTAVHIGGVLYRIIYLNRTCYNGLYRVNRSGQFNVPFGSYQRPSILDEPLLRAVSRCLKRVSIREADFTDVVRRAGPDDFVYFDPPYYPLSDTACFTAYDNCPFGHEEQERLARLMRDLEKRKVPALLSNSDVAATRKLYRGMRLERILASRPINSRGDRRGPIPELLVRNY